MKESFFWLIIISIIWFSNLKKERIRLAEKKIEQETSVKVLASLETLSSSSLKKVSPVLSSPITIITSSPSIEKVVEVMLIEPTSFSQNMTSSLIQLAKSNLGKPYKYGTIGPITFDCSGFVYAIHKQKNITLPRSALAQSKIKGNKITRKELKVGDLVFFDTSLKGFVNHSGIYLGENKFIHASSGKAYSVTISSLEDWYKDKFKWGKRVKK